jgi:hypothetical protein
VQIFQSIGAKFELARAHLARAQLSHSQADSKGVSAHLREAWCLFRDLRVPRYVERTEQLALRLDADISQESRA